MYVTRISESPGNFAGAGRGELEGHLPLASDRGGGLDGRLEGLRLHIVVQV
jgi:hypothetical protein